MKKAIFNTLLKCFSTVGMVLMLISVSNIYAQQTTKLNVTIALKVKDGDLKNSLVTVTRKNEPFKILDPGKGENTIELPLGYEYVFAFTKLGYETQKIFVDTHVPENRELRAFRKQIFKVVMEKKSEKDRPDVTIAYSKSIDDFDFIKGDTPKIDKTSKKDTVNTVKAKQESVAPVQDPTVGNKQNSGVSSQIKDKKVVQQDTKKITTITITIDEKDYIYKKEEFDWGGTFYYKNGVSITENTYRAETEE